MTITEIKVQLGIQDTKLQFKPSIMKDGTESTEWLRAWDNNQRLDVHMHVDVNQELVNTQGQVSTLSIQVEDRTSQSGQDYKFIRIVNHTSVVAEW